MTNNKTKENLTKDARIKAEIARLDDIFANVELKTKKSITSLINNAAFMAISLEDLQEIINEKGYVENYKNGANQFGMKKTSEIEIYNTMIKNHVTVMKQLTELLPKDTNINNDGFEDFVNIK